MMIRNMRAGDALDVANLLPALGYAADQATVLARFLRLQDWPEENVLLAEVDGVVAGLCHAQGVRRLDSDGYCEIVTLVVAQARQRQGIGRALVQHAMDWAWSISYRRVRLGSGVHREDAHRFYEAIGFAKSRPGHVFELRR